MKALKTVSVSVLVLAITGSALAFGGKGGERNGTMAELTEEQRAQVQQIMQEHRERNAPIKEAQQAVLESELRTVLTDEQIEGLRPKARGQMGMYSGLELTDEQKAQINELRTALRDSGTNDKSAHREAMQAGLAEILTDEQVAQLEERQEKMQERRAARGGEGRGEGRRGGEGRGGF